MRKLLVAASLAFLLSPAWALTEGEDYEKLEKPMPREFSDKVDLVEFFSYTCSHCRHLEPRLTEFRKTLPKDVNFRQLPVVWDERYDLQLAAMAAAVNLAGDPIGVNKHIYDAVFNDDEAVTKIMGDKFDPLDAKMMGKWLVRQTDIDGKTVAGFFGHPKTQEMAKQYAKMTAEYKVFSTPTIIVGGKYKLKAKDHGEKDFEVIRELIKKVREESDNSYVTGAQGPEAAIKALEPGKSQNAAPATQEAVKEKVSEVKDQAAQAADKIKDQAKEAKESAKEKASEVIEDVKDKASEAIEDAKDKASEAIEDAKDKAAQAKDAVEQTASDAAEAVKDAAVQVKEKADEVVQAGQEKAAEAVR